MRTIELRGARTNNLKGIDLDLEAGEIVVLVGPSGAGKSSLALATLYAEAQRRYVESFSAYARQFLERLPRPPVDSLDPIPAGVAIERQNPVRTSRSTVGTMTELTDYSKTLWAEAAELFFEDRKIERDTPKKIAKTLLREHPDMRWMVTYSKPSPRKDPEAFLALRELLLSGGYRRILIDDTTANNGEQYRQLDVESMRPSDVESREELFIVADRLVTRLSDEKRLVESLEIAMRKGGGNVVLFSADGIRKEFSDALHDPESGRSFSAATPNLFSFNNPVGACETCRGFGRTITVDWQKAVDKNKSLSKGAVLPWKGKSTQWERRELKKYAPAAGIDLDKKLLDYDDEEWRWLLDGDDQGWPNGWGGLRGWFKWIESKSYKMHVRIFLAKFRKYETCETCDGTRLKEDASFWKIDGLTIANFFQLPITEARAFIETQHQKFGSHPALANLLMEILNRLRALEDVGLGYLTLDRQSRTLSGGETQRVALTAALGSSLSGALFVLDEPTNGLHPADVARLLGVLRQLRDRGNVVVVIEHDPSMIVGADRVIEIGPGSGHLGGTMVFDGTPQKLLKANTLTGDSLRTPSELAGNSGQHSFISLNGATGNNLKNLDIRFPAHALTCVTGPSGSGKSSLITNTLVAAALESIGKNAIDSLPFISFHSEAQLDDIIVVDQSSMGRTSRGNAATYLKIWDLVRKRLGTSTEAKDLGLTPSHFSFNVPGGRCETCKGKGAETVEMQFLADVTFPCPVCSGRRFVGDVLSVKFAGHSVDEILRMNATEIDELGDTPLSKSVKALHQVGLSYLPIGQALSTLSGGEAQRLKLAAAISGKAKNTLFVFDEPSSGLHRAEVDTLIRAIRSLVESGNNTAIVIEHEMRFACAADHVIDLGPCGGVEGGYVLASGSPAEVIQSDSPTAPFILAEQAPVKVEKSKRPTKAKRQKTTSLDIEIVGAREHNLKNLNLRIPRNELLVVTGPSGSGKSSMVFDIIHAEGQRRFMETLSPYARQYMPELPRPDVDAANHIPPTISLEQRMTRGGGNSTVATVTEIAHFLRLLFARVGEVPEYADRDTVTSVEEFSQTLRKKLPRSAKVSVYAAMIRERKGFHREVLEKLQKRGIKEVRINREAHSLKRIPTLERYQSHSIEALVAKRIKVNGDAEIRHALRQAQSMSPDNYVVITYRNQVIGTTLSEGLHAAGLGQELDPRIFSFNTSQGGCASCEGKGEVSRRVGKGKDAYEEVSPCPDCGGSRLSSFARSIKIDGYSIDQLLGLPICDARKAMKKLRFKGPLKSVAQDIVGEMDRRFAFLEDVGLGYLELDRSAKTLSGGETQRVRLAAQLGNGLTGALYVLDEPTIGLHPRDTSQLIDALRSLQARGNTIAVVEHDSDMILAADRIVDMGPGGGIEGGEIIAIGTPKKLTKDNQSATGRALAKPFAITSTRKIGKDTDFLKLEGAREHNLKDIRCEIPLGKLVCVSGVSGSGKSTLIREVMLPALQDKLGRVGPAAGCHDSLTNFESIQRAVEVDQSPIGRTSRSVPATYIGIWSRIRELLAASAEARTRGWGPSRFSFNVAEGRCEFCEGKGYQVAEMAFMPDVHVPCDACGGLRFSRQTLHATFRGKNAGEILNLDINEAVEFFDAIHQIAEPLRLLKQLGLGYLKLGQPSNTLSGGEAQRIKLVSELGKPSRKRTLFVLDEPTTGLHRNDVEKLLEALHLLVDRGNSVVIIEHNVDMLLAADWLIDLGPEGGRGGGKIIAQGPIKDVLKKKRSHTARILREALAAESVSG